MDVNNYDEDIEWQDIDVKELENTKIKFEALPSQSESKVNIKIEDSKQEILSKRLVADAVADAPIALISIDTGTGTALENAIICEKIENNLQNYDLLDNYVKNDEDKSDDDSDILNKMMENNMKKIQKEENFINKVITNTPSNFINGKSTFSDINSNPNSKFIHPQVDLHMENRNTIYYDDGLQFKVSNVSNVSNQILKNNQSSNLISQGKESLFDNDFTSLFISDNGKDTNKYISKENYNNIHEVKDKIHLQTGNITNQLNDLKTFNSTQKNKYSNLNFENEIQINLDGEYERYDRNEKLSQKNKQPWHMPHNIEMTSSLNTNTNMNIYPIQIIPQNPPFMNMNPLSFPPTNISQSNYHYENYNNFNNRRISNCNYPQNDDICNVLENPENIIEKNMTRRRWFLMADNDKILGNFNSIDLLKFLEDKIKQGSKFENIFITDHDTDIYFSPMELYEILKENLQKSLEQMKKKKNMPIVGMNSEFKLNQGQMINRVKQGNPQGNFNTTNINNNNNRPYIDPLLVHMSQLRNPYQSQMLGMNTNNHNLPLNPLNSIPMNTIQNINNTNSNPINYPPLNMNINFQLVKNKINLNHFNVGQPSINQENFNLSDNNIKINNKSTKNSQQAQNKMFNLDVNNFVSNNAQSNTHNIKGNKKKR